MVKEHYPDTPKAQKLARLKFFLDKDPDNLALLSDIISLCVELKEWDQAETLALRALERHPSSPPINAHAAFVYLKQGETSKALDCFRKAIESGISDPSVLYNAAISAYSLGDFCATLDYLGLIPIPSDIVREVTLLSARCKHHLGDLQGAVEELSEHVDNNPDDREAHGLMALVLHDQGHSETALPHVTRACDTSDPPLEGILTRGSIHLEKGEYDSAYRDFSVVTEKYPHAAGRAWSGIGQIEFNNFQMKSAISALVKAVDTMPNHIGTWHLLGWAYLMSNSLDKALSSFKTAYDIDRNFGETHGGLASVYALSGDIQKAEKHIKLAERLDANGFASVYARMILLQMDGKQSQASDLFTRTTQKVNPVLGAAPEKLIQARLDEIATQNKDKQVHQLNQNRGKPSA